MADTDFLSAFLKIEELELVLEFFDEESLTVPTAVLREIASTDLLDSFNEEPRLEVVSSPDGPIKGPTERLGAGEVACIQLCSEDDLLLMDDRTAGRRARDNGVSVTSIPGFLYALRRTGAASLERVLEIKAALEEEDHYIFQDGFEKRLEEAR